MANNEYRRLRDATRRHEAELELDRAKARKRVHGAALNRTGVPLGYASAYNSWQEARLYSRMKITLPPGKLREKPEFKKTRRSKRGGKRTAADLRRERRGG